ncbi:outer membrane beta-barrel protein [Arsenicibacter rosenii]|uniref:Outer membrane protein beta-barrel domain-containing protein n=1 Tax=Arsenicibacter rosenii TaxID=1750698 RepID=A0A1S2VMM9_9BACT|nr:outer membrane beta-barrel protein [Arsenicibacter rosenii]OIN60019.1 hypothetical protein BLX24_08890 [Arsenicibacter rosenii]
MKKLLALLCTCAALSASAQDYKPFKVNLSVGFAAPTGQGAKGGVLMSIEPRYGLTDNFDVGLRVEGALIAKSFYANGQPVSSETKFSGSYVLTGTYFHQVNNFRPYAGIGLGIYSYAANKFGFTNSSDLEVSAGNKPGLMVRIGFKTGHFNMGAEYNIVGKTKETVTGKAIESTNSYVGIKVGVDIGGGKR